MDKMASRNIGIFTLLAALAVGTFNEFIPLLFSASPSVSDGSTMTIGERFVYVGMMFGPLPDWVKSWMAFQHYVFAGSLLFVLWHRGAQVYLLGITASHALSYAEIALLPTHLLGLDLVALNHWLWIPAWFVLAQQLRLRRLQSGYELWSVIALFQLSFSLVFDICDGFQFLIRIYS